MLLQDKKALIIGVANERSIAYAVAREFKDHGARLGFTYPGEAIFKRLEPISQELGGEFVERCDLAQDEDIAALAKTIEATWGKFDILVHSAAFAEREDLRGRFVDTSRKGFATAMDISAYSLVALCGALSGLMNPGASVMAMSYYGAEKVVASYNVMGVAKAALEASARYLAADLGPLGIRVNCLSPGPLKTLAASGIGGFKEVLRVVEETAPLRRNISQAEVGRSAVYLASELSSGVTGEVIHVDSGHNIMAW